MQKRHNERCPACKERVKHLLMACFGDVRTNWNLHLPSRIEDYRHTRLESQLVVVHQALQQHRQFKCFVNSKRLPNVDYFVPNQGFIVEFDESQHFTKSREIALSCYADKHLVGFSVEYWRSLCQTLNKKDNSPPYRDEQRAWYDTLRDFAPELIGEGQTIRLYSREKVWCSLNVDSNDDLLTFEELISCKRKGNK